MNEWQQLLRQTHPQFKNRDSELTSSLSFEEDPLPDDLDESKAEDTEGPSSAGTVELEWISPTVQLQEKIEKIPNKFGFKIGEAADYVGVKQYVLRYWESEFDGLKPKKSKNGQRMYTKRDVETALLIQKLLHEDRFSIEGARSALKRLKKQVRESGKPPASKEKETSFVNPSSEPVVTDEVEDAVDLDAQQLSQVKQSAERLLKAIQQSRMELLRN